MDLSLDFPDNTLFVRRVGPNSVTVVDRELKKSFILGTSQVIEDWPVTAVDQLDASHVETILALQPEVVLLGTGQQQRFPAAAFLAGFLRQGVGIEVMDNAAAARTHGLLAGEGRLVVTAFILPAA
ncbi:MAG: Mth938-like domain-containing protein [Dyella sp.]